MGMGTCMVAHARVRYEYAWPHLLLEVRGEEEGRARQLECGLLLVVACGDCGPL